MFTYIISHYSPSVRIIDLVSHTTNVVCVNFVHKWRNLQFKVDSERQIFWETFHGNFIYSQSLCQKSAERKLPKKYFLYFVLIWCLAWDSNPGFSFNEPTHYLLDHGDFSLKDNKFHFIVIFVQKCIRDKNCKNFVAHYVRIQNIWQSRVLIKVLNWAQGEFV